MGVRVRYVRNEEVRRVLLGVPEGHKHLRLAVELEGGEVLVFSEATVANIVRAYVTLLTHPTIRALELEGRRLSARKGGYAEYQLLETGKAPEDVESELATILSQARPLRPCRKQ